MSKLRPTVLEDGHAGIRLVPLAEDDVPDMASLIDEPGVLEYTFVPSDPAADFAQTWIDRYVQGWRDGSRAGFAIRARDNDAFLGFMAMVKLDLEASQGEAGYIVKQAARGHGVATRALVLLTDWAIDELGLERVEMHIDPTNEASIRVAERAGYTREGVLRSVYFKEGRRCDLAVFSVIRSDRSRTGE